jgi:hypothetical protein
MAAGSTYTPISTTTLGSTTPTVTFSSFSGYTDLFLVVNALNNAGYRGMTIQLNGDSGNNYSSTYINADTTNTATSGRSTNTSGYIDPFLTIAQTQRGVVTVNFMNYSNTTTYKTILSRGAVAINSRASVGLWRSTSAITSFTIGMTVDDFVSGSVFTLYGISAA